MHRDWVFDFAVNLTLSFPAPNRHSCPENEYSESGGLGHGNCDRRSHVLPRIPNAHFINNDIGRVGSIVPQHEALQWSGGCRQVGGASDACVVDTLHVRTSRIVWLAEGGARWIDPEVRFVIICSRVHDVLGDNKHGLASAERLGVIEYARAVIAINGAQAVKIGAVLVQDNRGGGTLSAAGTGTGQRVESEIGRAHV